MHVYQHVRKTFQKGGFNLLKGIGNSKVVTTRIPEKDRLEDNGKIFKAEPHTSSFLGMQKNMDIDTLENCRGADK